ncbi:hypothetical protein GF386_05795 [Candidatus Pacearchaeota archaeon]|nr:hypothetical protein [Candidatus Pacearchaeota archaeon]MBD3283606.1 hypothetical protein [Candidatus Pacearchaeota archaeon]
MKKIKRGIIVILLALIIFPSLSAQETEFNCVISNSEDWKDVYSSLHYANLLGVEGNFLVSTGHGNVILNEISKKKKVRVITSERQPYIFNYPPMIEDRGFAGADEITTDNANLELIRELPEINNFIIVDDSYGFSAMAVAPYATLTESWVFFSNERNIFEIDSILSRRNIEKIIIYGYVDQEVRETLSKYNPEIINNEDKFKDNIEITEKFIEIKPSKQIILTNGEFIETEIMKGKEPVLFTGRENVPEQIREYLKNSDIEVGVLIGNELVGAATNIRRSAGISVIVKFARGARSQAGGVAAVEGLDLFPLPTPYLELRLNSVKYNQVNSQLEVTYKSNSNIPAYFKGTITIISGEERSKVGDIDPIFIAPGDFKTISYSTNITKVQNLQAEVYTLYGQTSSALDRILQKRVNISLVNVIDRCDLSERDIKYVKYNKQKNSFIIKIKNSKDVDCWVDVELNNVIIGFTETILGTEGSTRIPKGKSKKIYIEEELTDDDLEKNPFVDLTTYSGERENSLVHVLKGRFPLKVEFLTTLAIISIILAIVIIILIIIFFIIKKREEEF